MSIEACRRRSRRGYTIVELMMGLTVFTIGVTGIISMQKVTVVSNQHAKNLAMATHIAQGWLDQLAADSSAWNRTGNQPPDLGDTTWLNQVANSATAWIRPAHSVARDFGPGFDALGNVVNADLAANGPLIRFCTHIRLSWLYPDPPVIVAGATPTASNGLIRAEVRVFWLREGEANIDPDRFICDPATAPADIGPATDRYHFVYHTTAIRQQAP
jgi:type II secretory pathway pseudopilin PulG